MELSEVGIFSGLFKHSYVFLKARKEIEHIYKSSSLIIRKEEYLHKNYLIYYFGERERERERESSYASVL